MPRKTKCLTSQTVEIYIWHAILQPVPLVARLRLISIKLTWVTGISTSGKSIPLVDHINIYIKTAVGSETID